VFRNLTYGRQDRHGTCTRHTNSRASPLHWRHWDRYHSVIYASESESACTCSKMFSTHHKGWALKCDTPTISGFCTKTSVMGINVLESRNRDALDSSVGQRTEIQSGIDTQWLHRQTMAMVRTSSSNVHSHALLMAFVEVTGMHGAPNVSSNRWSNKSSWLKRRQLVSFHMRFASCLLPM
jgi:hypothetical protein